MQGQPVDNHADLIRKIMARLGAPSELAVRRGALISGLGASPEYAAVDVVTVTPRLDPPELLVVDEVTDPMREVSADRGAPLRCLAGRRRHSHAGAR